MTLIHFRLTRREIGSEQQNLIDENIYVNDNNNNQWIEEDEKECTLSWSQELWWNKVSDDGLVLSLKTEQIR